ncbi:F-type H+-transporting ATPase subunit b [Lachnospiraceae bacterium RM5]|nr:F-type H+-transporting ATPase subunit b [Lachnospiraceae bacterium RM5]
MGERLFGLDAQTLFDTVILAINMFFMFLILSYLLFNPIKDMLKRRKDKIAKEREDAKEALNSAATLRSEYEVKIQNASKDAEKILADARKKALKNEEHIISEAKLEAARIIEHAKEEAKLEKQKAYEDIKKEIIDVATLMAGKVLNESIDEKISERLIDDTLKEIGESTWQS